METLIDEGIVWKDIYFYQNDVLYDYLTDEQKALFSRYTDCVREFQSMAECLLFQNSFRLGARIMLGTLD